MIRGRSAAAIFSLLLLSACGPRSTEFSSNVAPNLTFHPKALLVVQASRSALGPGSNKGFEDAFKASMATCGVSTAFFVKDPLALNPSNSDTTTDGRELKNVQADSELSYGERSVTRNGYGQLMYVEYDLTLIQRQPKRPIWKARTTLARGNVFTTSAEAGAALANAVFSAMVRDQVVQGCAAPQPQSQPQH